MELSDKTYAYHVTISPFSVILEAITFPILIFLIINKHYHFPLLNCFLLYESPS